MVDDAIAILHGIPIFGYFNRFFLDCHRCSVSYFLFTENQKKRRHIPQSLNNKYSFGSVEFIFFEFHRAPFL